MKIHRFIDQSFNLDKRQLTITDREIINQWKNVLRLVVGDSLILGDGYGFEAPGEIAKIASDTAEVDLGDKILNKNEPSKKVTLYCAILKKENFELVVQKAVEVGVTKIVPITTERTVKQNLRTDRLEKIAKEAAEQGGRGIIPEIAPIADFETALDEAVALGPTFLFDLTGPTSLKASRGGTHQNVNIFVGPEGGFTEKEVGLAKTAGATIASLGPLTLRGETAAIIASYLAVNNL